MNQYDQIQNLKAKIAELEASVVRGLQEIQTLAAHLANTVPASQVPLTRDSVGDPPPDPPDPGNSQQNNN